MPKIGTKSKFVYKPRDPEKVKKFAQDSGRKYEVPFKNGIDIFTPDSGLSNLRILPPTWKGAEHYGYLIFVHPFVGAEGSTFLCLHKMKQEPCPCCEAWKEAKDTGDEEEARAMSFSVQLVYWVIDRDGDEDVPLIYRMSKTRDSELIELSTDPKTGEVLALDHPDEGYDFSFKRTGKGKNSTKYIGTRLARKPSPIHEDDDVQDKILEFIMENPVPSVLKYHDYDHIQNAISGTAETKDEDLDEDTEEETRPSKRRVSRDDEDEDKSRGRRATRDEEEDDEEERPSRRRAAKDNDEEEEKPRGRRRAEPEEDEEEAPRSKRRSRDEEEEDEPEEKPRGRRRAEPEEEEDEEEDEPKPRARRSR